jgi:hypothetical protein
MPQHFQGRTEDASSIFLGADFWEKGMKVSGTVARVFEVKGDDGPATCYELKPVDGVEIDGEKQDKVSIGNLTGFRMALQAAGVDKLRVRDMIAITCTGYEKAKKEGHSDRANFEVDIVRP